MRERIQSSSSYHGHPCRDTVFVVMDEGQTGFDGVEVARVLLFFSFEYKWELFVCTFVHWFGKVGCGPDLDTEMWIVKPDEDLEDGSPICEVIDFQTIAHGAHLLPVYGSECVPEGFQYQKTLDRFNSFFINHLVDHHTHKFIQVIG